MTSETSNAQLLLFLGFITGEYDQECQHHIIAQPVEIGVWVLSVLLGLFACTCLRVHWSSHLIFNLQGRSFVDPLIH